MRAKHIIRFAAITVVLSLTTGPFVQDASAQGLIDLLQEQRHRAVADAYITEGGTLPFRGPDLLRVEFQIIPTESELVPSSDAEADFVIYKVRRIPKLGRNWFGTRFEDVEWSFLGSNELAAVDTMFTWKLRGLLQAEYGAPTQTLPDFGNWRDLSPDQYIQFEYWFVINNEIPLVVTDTNGPFERGIVVSSDTRFTNQLEQIRNVLFEPLLEAGHMSQYVDYYYDDEFESWYRTGYDGTDLFVHSIKTSEIGNGRPIIAKNR